MQVLYVKICKAPSKRKFLTRLSIYTQFFNLKIIILDTVYCYYTHAPILVNERDILKSTNAMFDNYVTKQQSCNFVNKH